MGHMENKSDLLAWSEFQYRSGESGGMPQYNLLFRQWYPEYLC